jgi:hypothetical protein
MVGVRRFSFVGAFDGEIAEILCYQGDVGESDRQKIEGYLAHKYGLADNLPAAHPYKNTVPGGSYSSGKWYGTTGDFYPNGYNPYIGSTAQTGVDGTTAPLGSQFLDSGLGYTYTVCDEFGVTAHNPTGSPLGGTAAWYANRESNLTPQGMNGLVLWLKPENIGVCGSVANGASADVWTDASPSANHAMPPTWDKWNGIFTSTLNPGAAQGIWTRQVYTTDPITRLQWVFNGLCGGFTTDRLMAVGLNSDPTTNASISSIDYSFYSYGSYQNTIKARRILYYEYNPTLVSGDLSNAGTNYTAFDNTVFEIEYVEPNIVYRMDGVVKRTVFAGYGRTFYMDSSFHNTTPHIATNGHCFTILGMWNGINPVVPTASTVTSSAGITSIVYAGVTVDKLRPTLQTAGFGGATGVSFNGGIVFAPASVYAGVTLGGVVGLGYTTGPGSSAAAMLTGQHLYLKRPLKITDDADIFVVYKSTRDGLSYGYGLLGSRNTNCDLSANPSVRFDSVLFSRSYNEQDRTAAQQTSAYYSILPNGTVMYPGASLPPTGVFGFRPAGDQTSTPQNTIVYDPHVSGACLGICVGEAVRDSQNKIDVFLNGDQGLNKSRSTGRRVASVSPPNTEDYLISKNLVYSFDAGKSSSIGEFATAKAANLLDSYPFVETPINVLAPQTTAMWRRDTVATSPLSDSVVLVTQDGGAALGSDEVYEFTTGSAGNIYLSRSSHPAAWADSALNSTAWTFTATIRRDDGGAINSASVYIYTTDSDDYAAGTIESIGGGWYKITRTKTGTSSTVTLAGIVGLGDFKKYRIGRAQLLPYPSGSDIAGTTTRTSSSYPLNYTVVGTPNANEIGYKTGPFSKPQIVWHGRNHSTINSLASFNSNVGFYTPSVAIDRTKLYRYSVWVNRAVLGNGNVYFGNSTSSNVIKRSDGTTDGNPYFTTDGPNGDAYTGKENQWVLVVGHIHPVGSGSGSNHPNSGFYLPNSGTTYAPLRGNGTDVNYSDKVWSSTSSTDALRVFLYGSSDQSTQVQFLQPRIEIVDGSEISIEDLTSNRINTLYDLSNSGIESLALNQIGYSSSVGGEVVFNGGPGVIQTNSSVPVGTSGNATWEAWIKPNKSSSSATHDMFMGYEGPLGHPFFAAPYTTNNRILWATTINGVQQVVSTPIKAYTVGQWCHVVFVSTYENDTTTMKIYVNGVLSATSTYSGKEGYAAATGSYKFAIGNRNANYRYREFGADYAYDGSVSNVRIYSRALSEAEIRQNYNSLRSRFSL